MTIKHLAIDRIRQLEDNITKSIDDLCAKEDYSLTYFEIGTALINVAHKMKTKEVELFKTHENKK